MTGIDLKVERIKKRLSLSQVSKNMKRSIGWLSELENDKIKITPKIVSEYMEAIEK